MKVCAISTQSLRIGCWRSIWFATRNWLPAALSCEKQGSVTKRHPSLLNVKIVTKWFFSRILYKKATVSIHLLLQLCSPSWCCDNLSRFKGLWLHQCIVSSWSVSVNCCQRGSNSWTIEYLFPADISQDCLGWNKQEQADHRMHSCRTGTRTFPPYSSTDIRPIRMDFNRTTHRS